MSENAIEKSTTSIERIKITQFVYNLAVNTNDEGLHCNKNKSKF